MNAIQYSPWKLGGLSLGELLKRTWKEVNDDNAYDAAAALGYYFLFALFPMLILMMALLTTFNSTAMLDKTLSMLSHIMPGDSYKLISSELPIVARQSKGGLLTFGIILTIWSASSGVVSVIDGLNRAYEVKEERSFIKRRLLGIALTIALVLLTFVGGGLVVGGDQLAGYIADAMNAPWMTTVGTIAGVVLGLIAMFAGLELVFYFGPNVHYPKWYWVSPGSLAAVIIFILGSLGFSQYVRFSNSYSSVAYGSLGAVMVLMLWLFILGLAIVIGGEINSEIAKAALAHGSVEAPRVGRAEMFKKQQNVSGLPAQRA